MEPKDFQNNSAKRIVELFNNGRTRVLLADEVGLGKTIVARAVVERMREIAKKKGEPFKVIYVCSNQGIIQQNAYKLGIEKEYVVTLSESRLSMQHKLLYKEMYSDYLIPITPTTSLVTSGYGNASERALIYALIYHRFADEEHKHLKWYLDVYGNQKENNHTEPFNNISDIKKDFPSYFQFIQNKLDKKACFPKLIKEIKDELKKDTSDKKYINELRSLFCEISMEMLHPNLVIMDEFQRYRDIMKGGADTEENRLAQRLFNADSKPKILLISATPYKSMVTMEDIAQDRRNEHFEDFNNLMRFLMEKDYDGFKTKWDNYSNLLGQLSNDTIDKLIVAKNEAEEVLRKVMVRTERYVPNLASYTYTKVRPTKEEVKEYKLLRDLLLDAAKSYGKKPPTLNIDYVKSASFLLSFMQQYVEKDFIDKAFKKKPFDKDIFDEILLSKKSIDDGDKLKLNNARLNALCEMIFGAKDYAAYLLWIPASMPYYKPEDIFDKCSDFSKILVFSRWGFVPRMLATVLSYKAAQPFVSKKDNASHSPLDKYKELLLSPFPNLADLFKPINCCDDLKQVKKRIKDAIKEKVRINNKLPITGYANILNTLKQLNDEFTDHTTKIAVDDKTLDFIVNIIIASPGVCLWRCFGDDYGESYEVCCKSGLYEFANAFINMLGNDESQGIIKKIIKNGRIYERVVEYCMNGNLQAVFDEYAFVLGYNSNMDDKGKTHLWETMSGSIISRAPLEVDTKESFCAEAKKSSIQRWFACDYAKLKFDDDDEKRKSSVQSAFNSPFRPFVLASTSVGQEGLDFHLYCRKIVHWNIPSNPIDLEQRSGRIDRYESLAIRRNVAHLFNDTINWKELFAKAYAEWHKVPNQYNDLVPYWCLPKEVLENKQGFKIENIENIFLLYPMSLDEAQFKIRKQQLSLYRLTMGQPNQEYIIDLLERNGIANDDNKKEKLMFHLSPNDNA